VQVKTVRANNVLLEDKGTRFDYLVVCNVENDPPVSYILTLAEIAKFCKTYVGKSWLQYRELRESDAKDRWEKIAP